ncbi:vitamin K-dependent gamma-carboxylase-like protein [Leucobacter luti]|uniref:Vitamin K-dependent gamma-carboxylase-like protein n=1 Tax=Leucobacter luti TaxID=340320 RepID=A0A4V3CXC4_9MICO|nr:HTTM domain-containing protein [Leucobacter luti]TDP89728.1 vitamin K-dependent gamma-carboxylase-like protein [Leucobacter luti]
MTRESALEDLDTIEVPVISTKPRTTEPVRDSPALPRVFVFVGTMLSTISTRAVLVLLEWWRFATTWLFDAKRAQYGIAVTRMLMGVTAIGLLLTNWSTRLYSFGAGAAWNGELESHVSEFANMWLFSLFPTVMGHNLLYTMCYIGLLVLALIVTLGWRFRIVAPVFWVMWVSFIEASDMLGDQGDNMFRIAFLLLMFTDPALQWSLDARRRDRKPWFVVGSVPNQLGTVVHNLALAALIAQVIFVYTSGALFKAAGAPWREGWAVYDPLSTARFGTWPALSDFLTAWGPMVALFTLGSVFLQAAFPFLLLNRVTRILALVGILSFHIGIAVLMGLPWFSLTMIAIDSVFIRDRSWQRACALVRRTWRGSLSPRRGDGAGIGSLGGARGRTT